MTGKDLKIWLIEHDYTQCNLAEKLGMTTRTVSKYANSNSKLPLMFVYALKGVQIELKGE